MTDADTRLVALIGKPARHSLSPVMHSAAFRELKLNYTYLAFEPENLKKAIDGLKELGAVGFNVTMPFKAEVIKHLDRVDPVAKKIGAVNTVVNDRGKLVGYNTDGIGAVASLKGVTALKGKKVLVLGSGGAGKAIGFYLMEEGAKVTVVDRTPLKAIKLAKLLDAESLPLESANPGEFDVVVNASPAGMKPKTNEVPIPSSKLHKGQVVFDIVYEPVKTRFLAEAGARGCKTINGLEMLLNQGYAGFRLFTGKEAPKTVMREAIIKELGGKY